ncbi:MAG: alkaline phosphatase D family protein [Bacteroidota bacterium]
MRAFYYLFYFALLAACATNQSREEPTSTLAAFYDLELKPFYHGVASGDPLQDAVVIWTRVTPDQEMERLEVEWEFSTDQDFENIIQSGTFTTGPSRDYTVKVDVSNLAAGNNYFYRFKSLEAYSAIGRTKTAPAASDLINFAVVSCSNYEFGYFNAYGHIARQEDLDAVIHLGDYIYEYGTGSYGDSATGRFNLPPYEIVSLEDYRTRYSLYRLDPDLQSVHNNHPMIAIWDDHEIANNSYETGAQNHQEDEGPYEERRSAAVQAYYEWLPIRENSEHYRKFDYGDLVDLIMLDERLEGRSRPLDSLSDPALMDSSRSMLGQEQLVWLKEQLLESEAQWKVIGNQVIFSYLNWGYEPNFTINLDSWDGYPIEQREIADFIKEIDNVIFITGDTHSSWAFEVTVDPFETYDPESAAGAVAVEFGTTSINSANSNERVGTDTVLMHEKRIVNSPINPHLKYANLRDHGYLLLSLTPSRATASWHYVPTLMERVPEASIGKQLYVNAGEVKLRE